MVFVGVVISAMVDKVVVGWGGGVGKGGGGFCGRTLIQIAGVLSRLFAVVDHESREHGGDLSEFLLY